MARRLKASLYLLTLAAFVLAFSPGPSQAEADCFGFISGMWVVPCVKCINAGGQGTCISIFSDADCTCGSSPAGCISGGGFCEFLFGDP